MRTAIPSGVVIDLQLPAGVDAEDRLLDAIRNAPGIVRVERRAPGFVRLLLGPQDPGVAVVVPLPIRWSVRGDLAGLGAIAHPFDRPEAMTILAPRRLAIAASEDLE
jgi:hypothetical protein